MFDGKALTEIKDLLIGRNETLSVAESVTSGLLQVAFSSAEFASRFFQGGITVYNLAQKFRHLKVEPIHAQSVNCVSERVAVEMALNCEDLFGSQWSIGITGYASPVPESDNKLFAYYAISRSGKVIANDRIESVERPGLDTQTFYTNELLIRFLRELRK